LSTYPYFLVGRKRVNMTDIKNYKIMLCYENSCSFILKKTLPLFKKDIASKYEDLYKEN
jgi:hypothetical protein